ncbi:8875_t:CDS:1, partial [Racocetra fulgida]
LQEQSVASESSVAGLVKGLLGKAEYLMDNSISVPYKKDLEKAWYIFE